MDRSRHMNAFGRSNSVDNSDNNCYIDYTFSNTKFLRDLPKAGIIGNINVEKGGFYNLSLLSDNCRNELEENLFKYVLICDILISLFKSSHFSDIKIDLGFLYVSMYYENNIPYRYIDSVNIFWGDIHTSELFYYRCVEILNEYSELDVIYSVVDKNINLYDEPRYTLLYKAINNIGQVFNITFNIYIHLSDIGKEFYISGYRLISEYYTDYFERIVNICVSSEIVFNIDILIDLYYVIHNLSNDVSNCETIFAYFSDYLLPGGLVDYDSIYLFNKIAFIELNTIFESHKNLMYNTIRFKEIYEEICDFLKPIYKKICI